MHFKPLTSMALCSTVYSWMEDLEVREIVPWKIRPMEELAAAALLLPLAVGWIRWTVDDRVRATDATITMGGATSAYVAPALATNLYRFNEARGCATRLRIPLGELADPLLPPSKRSGRLMNSANWHITRSAPLPRPQHINLQEFGETLRETQSVASCSCLGRRVVIGTDSIVDMGAWAKGRSGSPPPSTHCCAEVWDGS